MFGIVGDFCARENVKILISFSGGPDSVYLFHQLKHEDVTLVYFNHQLRPKAELRKEIAFVRGFSTLHGVPLIVRKIPVRLYSKRKKVSVEAAGRELRYRILGHLARLKKADAIATGHHLDDLCETFFHRILRGTKSGFGGRAIDKMQPLLRTSKQQILAWLDENKIVYSKDSSNLDRKYTRNFIRHDLMPVAEKINSRYREHVAELVDYFSELQAYLDEAARPITSEIIVEGGLPSLPLSALDGHPEFIRNHALVLMLREAEFFSSRWLNEVKKLLAKPGKSKISFGKGHFLVKDKKFLAVRRAGREN